MTDDELRQYAEAERDLHDPAQQDDNPYERCALCHYTRHPCSVYDLATEVLRLLADRRCTPDPPSPRADGRAEPA